MALDDIYLVSEKVLLTPHAELDALEAWLGVPLPRGYRKYMATLGDGTYCDLVNILTPTGIRDGRECHEKILRENYLQLWRDNEAILSFDEAISGVLFATTCDSDQVYYVPGKEQQLFVLPRHDDAVYWLGAGFEDPLDWRSAKGKAQSVYQPPFHYFEPTQDRQIIELFTADTFDIQDLAQWFKARLSGQDVRSIHGPNNAILFPQGIGGRIQLTQAPDDPRLGIRIDYDKDCSAEVDELASELCEMGFYETWRHRTAWPLGS